MASHLGEEFVKSRVPNPLRAFIRSALFQALPPRKRLPAAFLLDRLQGRLEPELRYLHRYCPTDGSAVDVGANYGHYSYRLSQLFSRVLAFEINGDILNDLKSYNHASIQIIHEGLSSSPGDIQFFIPLLNGQPLSGWTSFDPNNLPGSKDHLKRTARVTTLDSYALEDVSFIKIDVEGHEREVLEGAASTLLRCQPMLLVEVRVQNSAAVDAFLSNIGYVKHCLRDLLRINGSPENWIFIHREKTTDDRRLTKALRPGLNLPLTLRSVGHPQAP